MKQIRFAIRCLAMVGKAMLFTARSHVAKAAGVLFHGVQIEGLSEMFSDPITAEDVQRRFEENDLLFCARGTICWQLWLRQRFCRSAYHRAKNPSTDCT